MPDICLKYSAGVIGEDFEGVTKSVSGYLPKTKNVYSNTRSIIAPAFIELKGLKLNQRQKIDGLKLLKTISDNTIPLVFFDPQYRSVLDRQLYGNEGKSRGKSRSALAQMNNKIIKEFLCEIERIVTPGGHLMMWVDKYIICSGISVFMEGIDLQLVDMITWNKQRMSMGYRSRRYSEHLVIFQKKPIRAKGVWRIHNIPDVWDEKITNKNHPHAKPAGLQKRLIEAVTNEGDIVLDPSAGGYSVLYAANKVNRNFLGCDILG